ncbi:MAG: acetylornithine deacetylase [Betaproteobacteria bacterium]
MTAAMSPEREDALLAEAVSILARLVAFPTVSADPNVPLIEYVRALLAGHGVDSELFANDAGTKASLWATVGPAARPGLVLSGHTDVVPAAGQAWTRSPFVLTDEGDRLYGRGTADMKGFLACVLAMVPVFVARGGPVPIHLAFSYDEEIGCLGVRPMLAEIARRRPLPLGCVIGEPTGGRPVTAHKGKVAVRCDVVGRACHSAHAPEGVNAVEKAARLIVAIEDLAQAFAARGPRDARFDPPFATAQTGVFSGGSSVNVVPARASFSFEARSTDEAELDGFLEAVRMKAERDVLPAMRTQAAEAEVRFEQLTRYPALRSADDETVVALALEASGEPQTGVISFGSEGGLFVEAGIPAVICGPGSMDQGHKPDEFVTRAELRRCLRFLSRLGEHLQDSAGGPG